MAEPEGSIVGTLDEDFAVESNRGDIMLLGNTSWRIRRVEGKVWTGAGGRCPRRAANGSLLAGGGPGPHPGISAHVADLRQEISERLPESLPSGSRRSIPEVAETVAWLKEECGLDDSGAEQAIEYIMQGRAVLGAVPTQNTIIAERFFDEGGGMQLVIHAPFGGASTKPGDFRCASDSAAASTSNFRRQPPTMGSISPSRNSTAFRLADVFHFLNAETAQDVLEQAALDSPIFGTRWRWDANRALALLRFQGGKKVPPQIQRMRSDDLLASVFPDVAACQENIVGEIKIPNHPLVNEVMKDVLTEAMDIEGLKDLLRRHREWQHSLHCRGHAGTVAVLARNSECESLCLPR